MRFLLLSILIALPAAAANPYAINGVDIDAIVARMSLKERVGQMLFLGFGGTVMDDTIGRFLDEKKPGAVALFSRNVKGTDQILRLIRDVRKHDPAGIPMFVSVDQEGGRVIRLRKDATILPSNMAIGATFDADLAERAGVSLGKDLAIFGFNMNLAPVLDVNSNPDNPVIGVRSFGSVPSEVARLGVAFMRGMQSEGISAVAKHFPGHGDAAVDSHHAMPSLPHDKERLYAVELPPFRRALAEGLDALMTAHIALPKIAEEADMPATVSKNVLTGMLRNDLGYQGLLVTDGLEMEGIVSRYGSGEAAVRAVEAGADMVMVLWFKEKKDEVQKALLDAVKSGRLSEKRIELSVRRILETKARRGIFAQKLLPVAAAKKALKNAPYRSVVDDIAARAITLVKNEGELVPVRPGQKIVALSTESLFLSQLAKKGAKTMRLSGTRSERNKRGEVRRAMRLARKADVVVVATRNAADAALVNALLEAGRKVVVVSFESPYIYRLFPKVDAYLCAYSVRPQSVVSAARAVLGAFETTGKLPVPVGEFAVGHRVGNKL